MKLRYKGHPVHPCFRYGGRVWVEGDEDDVDPKVGSHLLSDHGDYFEEVAPEPQKVALDAPPRDKSVKAPKVKAKRKLPKLKRPKAKASER